MSLLGCKSVAWGAAAVRDDTTRERGLTPNRVRVGDDTDCTISSGWMIGAFVKWPSISTAWLGDLTCVVGPNG